MSASKARLTAENHHLRHENQELTFKLVRLLAYVMNLREDYPQVEWPDLPDSYSEMIWRYAA
jgi:hypothetical protein